MLTSDHGAGSEKVLGKEEILWEQGNPERFSLSTMGVDVEYHYQTNGIEWIRIFELTRPNTNSTVWTMIEADFPADTNLWQQAWRRNLITVTEEP
jgi:hypothetical protein